jgi:hypothetical protein
MHKIEVKDYRFFLEYKNFYKMVDTLEKYQNERVDLATAEGRSFIVFKRQLYQLYEIQNRSAAEHEAFSFALERENLKWLFKASQEFQMEMIRQNRIDDLANHYFLKGALYKRKTLSPQKLYGLAYFGLSASIYSMFPAFMMHFG